MKTLNQSNPGKWEIKLLESFEDAKSIKNLGDWYLCKDEEFWNLVNLSFKVYLGVCDNQEQYTVIILYDGYDITMYEIDDKQMPLRYFKIVNRAEKWGFPWEDLRKNVLK